MERNLELQDLLSDLRQDGEVVSSEADFTLHSSKAEQKLKEYQLRNPHFYILKLVQSAILSGCTKVEIVSQSHQVSLTHDGSPPSKSDLKNLLNYLFVDDEKGSKEQRALKRLASGINTAVASSARELVVECHTESGIYLQKWTAGSATFEERESSEERVGLTFTLKRKAGEVVSLARNIGGTSVADLVSSNRNAMQKEEAALWDRCIFSPVEIHVNGQRFDRRSFGVPRYPGYNHHDMIKVPLRHWLKKPSIYHQRVCHQRYHLIQAYYASDNPTVTLRSPAEKHSYIQSAERPHQPGTNCSLIMGIEANRDIPNRLNFVRDGVLIEQGGGEYLPFRGIFGLVDAGGLNTDLSGFSIVKNDKYRDLMAFVKKAAGEIGQEYLDRKSEIPFGL